VERSAVLHLARRTNSLSFSVQPQLMRLADFKPLRISKRMAPALQG
jgi:hypothetical protein